MAKLFKVDINLVYLDTRSLLIERLRSLDLKVKESSEVKHSHTLSQV